MTIPELIAETLRLLEGQFYGHLPPRDFARDRQYLVGAIATYGYECSRRGWEFDADTIFAELRRLLISFKRSGSDVTWMPNYLQHAIRRHIGEHAEELSSQAKAINNHATRAVTALRGAVVAEIVREPTPAELLGRLYKDVNRLRRQQHAVRRVKSKEERRQKDLL